MTKYHGKNVKLYIGASPSDTSLVDVSNSVLNTVDFPRTNDEVDVTTFGAGDFRSFLSGFQGATIRVQGFWEDDSTKAGYEKYWNDWSISGTQQRMFRFAPSGSAAAKVYYEGTAIILGFSINGAIANAVSFSTDLRVTGSITRGTF